MTKKKTVWLIIAIGIAALTAAFFMLYGSAEEKTHEGARFVMAEDIA